MKCDFRVRTCVCDYQSFECFCEKDMREKHLDKESFGFSQLDQLLIVWNCYLISLEMPCSWLLINYASRKIMRLSRISIISYLYVLKLTG